MDSGIQVGEKKIEKEIEKEREWGGSCVRVVKGGRERASERVREQGAKGRGVRMGKIAWSSPTGWTSTC